MANATTFSPKTIGRMFRARKERSGGRLARLVRLYQERWLRTAPPDVAYSGPYVTQYRNPELRCWDVVFEWDVALLPEGKGRRLFG